MKNQYYILALLLIVSACGDEPSANKEAKEEIVNVTPVYVQEIENGTFQHYLNVQGTVESDRTILVSPKTTATVTRIHVRTGDRVKQGQVLATLDGDITASQIEEVENQLELAQTLYDKQKNLNEQGIGSEVEYLQAENRVTSLKNQLNTLNKQYNNYSIKATISGTVNRVMLKEGETVNMGSNVFQIANSEALKVTAEISEAYITSVDASDSVEISIPSIGVTYHSTLDVVSKVIDPSNRTFTVEIYIPDVEGMIRPNMIAKVRINDITENDQIVIPINVVSQEAGADYVFVAQQKASGWTSEQRQVTMGKNYQDQVVIENGLKTGELIITTGYNELAPGKAISIEG